MTTGNLLKKVLSIVILVQGCTPSNQARNETSAQPSSPTPSVIRIGLQPNEATLDLEPLAKQLSARIGRSVQLIASKDYQELTGILKEKRVDFAFLTGLNFIQAERELELKVLLKKVYGKAEFYYSAIVVPASSKIKAVKDLKGKVFGFVDPKSTSGYLYPRVILRAAGLDAGPNAPQGPNSLSFVFAGTHDKAMEALMDSKVDAVGVWSDDPSAGSGAWTGEPSVAARKNPKFRVLAYSDPIPNDAFVVRKEYFDSDVATVFKTMDAFIGLGDDPEHLLKKYFKVDSMATATSRHYDSVRALESLVESGAK